MGIVNCLGPATRFPCAYEHFHFQHDYYTLLWLSLPVVCILSQSSHWPYNRASATVTNAMPSRTVSQPYSQRANNPAAPPLSSYLLQLISIKQSNLCVSADVHTSSALLRLAEDVGDHICVLKTHADIIDDFSEQTIKRLIEVSRRKNFLLFEDRKFGDIGSASPCDRNIQENDFTLIWPIAQAQSNPNTPAAP